MPILILQGRFSFYFDSQFIKILFFESLESCGPLNLFLEA